MKTRSKDCGNSVNPVALKMNTIKMESSDSSPSLSYPVRMFQNMANSMTEEVCASVACSSVVTGNTKSQIKTEMLLDQTTSEGFGDFETNSSAGKPLVKSECFTGFDSLSSACVGGTSGVVITGGNNEQPQSDVLLKQNASGAFCNDGFEAHSFEQRHIVEKSEWVDGFGPRSSSAGAGRRGLVVSTSSPREVIDRQVLAIIDDHLGYVKTADWGRSESDTNSKSESKPLDYGDGPRCGSETRCGGSSREETHRGQHTMHSPPSGHQTAYTCGICKEGFNSEESIFEHWCSVHSESKQKFECVECRKVLIRLGATVVGKNKETGDKLYICHACRETRESPKTRTRGWVCKICRHVFVKSSTFQLHQQQRFECEMCQKPFCYKSSLTAHLKTHSNKRMMQCETCRIWFANLTALRLHWRDHTEKKPYVCLCGKAFRTRRVLDYHRHTHSKAVKRSEVKRSTEYIWVTLPEPQNTAP